MKQTQLPAHILAEDPLGRIDILDITLEVLGRPISLIWNRRLVETIGSKAAKARALLHEVLREVAQERGLA